MEKFYPYSSWDSLIKSRIQELNKDWKTFCDVGACQGEYTMFFSNLSSDSKVYAFEANPNNYRQLNNIFSTQRKNCIIENFAIADTISTVEFYSHDESAGQHMSSMSKRFEIEYNHKYEVGSMTLDEYFKDIDVDCIKIDVEGSENLVIKGGMETIKKSKFCIIECHWDEDWEEIFTLLTSNNMIFRDITNDQKITVDYRPYQIYKIID